MDNHNKKYVDDTTVSKTDDAMSGNLMMNVKNKPSHTLVCNALKGNTKLNVLLGNTVGLIFHQSNYAVMLQTSNGLLCCVGDLDIINFNPTTDVYQSVEMNDIQIFKLAEPMDVQDAFTKRYVSKSISDDVAAAGLTTSTYVAAVRALFLKLDGSSIMAGSLNIGGHSVTKVAEHASAQDAATKNYRNYSCLNKLSLLI